eukprot:510941-Prorocentrum_minimum.AAC.2
MLRRLEQQTGRRVKDMFDLIGGTSSGGILAVGLGITNFTLDDCEALYRNLGVQARARARNRQSRVGERIEFLSNRMA